MSPSLSRVNNILALAIFSVLILYFGATLLIPITFGCLLAMLMAPLCAWLDSKGAPRGLSSFLSVLVLFLALLLILGIVSLQAVNFSKEFPKIEEKSLQLYEQIQGQIARRFDVSPEEQKAMIEKQVKKLGSSAGNYFGSFISGLFGTLGNLVLTAIITFLLLYGKEKYKNFFLQLTDKGDVPKMKKILHDVAQVSQQYLRGRAISMSIQAALFSIGLLIIGIKNAILLGCIAGLMTIIPYVGPLLGGLFPVLVSLTTGDSIQTTIWVLVLLVCVQTLDNNFIEPRVVGGKVNISALTTILGLVVGGTLWGIAGMVLFIPLLGIAKIICDHIPSLKPYAYLIGDPDQEDSSVFLWVRSLFKSSKTKARKPQQ